jgi:hypothetical protein
VCAVCVSLGVVSYEHVSASRELLEVPRGHGDVDRQLARSVSHQ